MSQRGEMWVHGSAAVMQFPSGGGAPDSGSWMDVVDGLPWTDLLGARDSRGSRFTGKTGVHNFFHFSVPAPAIVPVEQEAGHMAITIDRVSVYYTTPNRQIFIDGIAVHAGRGGAGRETSADLRSADFLLAEAHDDVFQDHLNSWMLVTPITLALGRCNGVSISVGVRFGVQGVVTFTGAAIHYALTAL